MTVIPQSCQERIEASEIRFRQKAEWICDRTEAGRDKGLTLFIAHLPP
jgi:hypothetical protein